MISRSKPNGRLYKMIAALIMLLSAAIPAAALRPPAAAAGGVPGPAVVETSVELPVKSPNQDQPAHHSSKENPAASAKGSSQNSEKNASSAVKEDVPPAKKETSSAAKNSTSAKKSGSPARDTAKKGLEEGTAKRDKREREREIALPIVMYHSTSGNRPGKWELSPAQLDRDFTYITERGYTAINVADLIGFAETGEIAAKPIMITFDDGYVNNYLNAFPIIKKYKIKVVMSVIGRVTDENYAKDGKLRPTTAHLTYEQIKEMSDSGLVEIQNHTYDMHGNGGNGRLGMRRKRGESAAEYEKAVRADLGKWRDKLKERIGVRCTAVAYPFGEYNKDLFRIVKEMGFKAAFSCNEKVNRLKRNSDLFCLGRYNRGSGKSSEAFFKKMDVV